MKDLKVIFMGTPNFGEESLRYLIENTNVVLVVTQPDKLIGRKKELSECAIKKIALEFDIPVFQPTNIKVDYKTIEDYNPDLIITAAYGQIVPKGVLDIPRLGCLNLHGSILPKYRGAAPIQWSLINGDKETGVSLMYMDESMDTGDIVDIGRLEILKEDNFFSLYEKLGKVAKDVLEKNIESIAKETNNRTPQDNDFATYARMLNREDELIDLFDTVENIYNKFRGIYPNAYILFNDEPLKLLDITYRNCSVKTHSVIKDISKDTISICGTDGVINLHRVKPFGKKEMDIKSYLNGCKPEYFNNLVINDTKM
ncbi:MAG: methionyl-tRNA formyltransferase [bacterium]